MSERFILNETSYFGWGSREVLIDEIKKHGDFCFNYFNIIINSIIKNYDAIYKIFNKSRNGFR